MALALGVCVLASIYPFVKQTSPMYVVRALVTLRPIGKVVGDDLVDDVRHKRELVQLQG
jgi:hypothetical protein